MKWPWQKRKPRRPADLEDRFRDLDRQFDLLTRYSLALSGVQIAKVKEILEEMIQLEEKFEVRWSRFDGLRTRR